MGTQRKVDRAGFKERQGTGDVWGRGEIKKEVGRQIRKEKLRKKEGGSDRKARQKTRQKTRRGVRVDETGSGG
jgi:hypothetical protein